MNRWDNLSLQEKNQLLGIYASKGYTDLASIISHYNTFQAGGPIKKESNYSVGRVLDGIYRAVNHEEFMGEPSHKYQFIKPEYVGLSEEELDSLVGQADERGHRLDVVKAEAHPSHYSRGTWSGNDFELTDKGLAEVNHTYFGLNDGGQDPQARLTYKGSTVLPEITITPDGAYIYNTYDNIKLHLKQQGGSLGKITPYGQWQYPHQVTTIPSNNITMKGVDYPVIGISNTGDTKYMLPNMDYLFEGQYVTEYPVKKFQLGGITTGSYPTYNVPFSDTDDHTWLKWWYSGRPNQIGNAYKEYDISYNKNKRPKSLDKYNETGLNEINRSIDIAMKTPINFTSLRDNTLLGQYTPEGEAHIDIRRDQENHPSTVLHERIHALNENLTGAHHVKSILGNFLQNPILMQISPKTGTVDYREKLNGYVDSYWDNSNEIYSRLMQFRRDTRTSPLKKWNEEDIINLRKNKTLEKYNLDGYTNEFILHLFNDVADNNNKDYLTLV